MNAKKTKNDAGSHGILKRLLLTATSRGGCGKSWFCLNLVDWLMEHPNKVPFRAFDPDSENKTLSYFHPENTAFFDISREGAVDECFNVFKDVDVSLVDGLGSQQFRVFGNWVDETNLLSVAKEWHVGITYITVIDDSAESVEQAYRDFNRMGDSVEWVVVLNGHERLIEHFSMWPGSKAFSMFEELKAAGGAKLIEFNKVPAHLIDYMRANKLTFSRGRDADISILDKNRFIKLHQDYRAAFDKIEDLLLPTKYLRA